MAKFIKVAMLVAIFIAAGVNKLQDPAAVAQHIQSNTNVQFVMKTAGLTLKPEEFVLAAQAIGGFEVGAAVLLLLNFLPCMMCFLLMIFTIATTALFHIPDVQNPASVLTDEKNMINVMKNIAIVGGLMLAAGCSPGSCGKKK